jgi:predicted secreted hydrolase
VRSRALLTSAAVAAAVAAVLAPGRPGRAPASRETRRAEGTLEMGPAEKTAGFARATTVRDFRLPEDHGPHFDYQTEWWYSTGHVADEGGRLYGFQLTFFRRGLSPGPPPGGPGLLTNQVFFAHFAVTDAAAGTHVFDERWARGAGGLAGARARPFAVWLEGWRVEARDAEVAALHLAAGDGSRMLDLDLRASKPLVRHGEGGLSAKSGAPGNASYYVGYTRLAVTGRLDAGDGGRAVSGEAWFDHEWSTSALGPGAVGWDWLSLQLEDGLDLMYFRIRREDGSDEPVSRGTLVAGDGRTRHLRAAEILLDVLGSWTSPATGTRYPSRWRLRVPDAGLDLLVEPWVADQEMRTSFVYWEGAVRVSGRSHGVPVEGNGYVELTGYAGSMQGVF